MGNDSRRWVFLIAIPTAIGVGILNVFLFFLFMVLYGHVIAPGHDESYYQEAANRFGPYASIIGGIPVMFVAGVVLRRILGDVALKVGILAWCIYVAVDMAILVAVGQFWGVLPHIAVSFSTKLLAIYFGARPKAKEEKIEEN